MIVYGSELDADKICIIISIYFLHSYPILFCSWSDIVLNVKVVFFLFYFDVTENGVYHVTNSMLTKEVEIDGLVRPDFVNNNIFPC